ncbi:hypothetical protein Bbelb_042130 [Branchiostoma belcheri]|nr:hypothetical protein Bbelb_042130 [Branchiostoma belcheri]
MWSEIGTCRSRGGRYSCAVPLTVVTGSLLQANRPFLGLLSPLGPRMPCSIKLPVKGDGTRHPQEAMVGPVERHTQASLASCAPSSEELQRCAVPGLTVDQGHQHGVNIPPSLGASLEVEKVVNRCLYPFPTRDLTGLGRTGASRVIVAGTYRATGYNEPHACKAAWEGFSHTSNKTINLRLNEFQNIGA